MVQSNHATLTIASSSYNFEGIPNIVLIGVPDVAALKRAQYKLSDLGIVHYAWHEPDGDLGFTSIATVPLGREEKEPLKQYRLWRHPMFARSSEKERSSSKVDEGSVVQFHPGEPTSCARVA